MSATCDVAATNFESIVKSHSMVLLDFWASWCGPCRIFGPIFERAAQAHPDIVFGKVDTEQARELAAAFSITSIPTLVAIKDRTVVFSQPGALPDAALGEVIDQLRKLELAPLSADASGPAD